jgi:glycosyltransferase involved in cell wall biosynthesis
MKVAIIITTYNRPQYLAQCFASLKRATFPRGSILIIVDDASTNEETRSLVRDFVLPGVEVVKHFNPKNKKVAFCLDLAFHNAFDKYKADLCINLDSDALVKVDFVERLADLHKRFPEHIGTGFNSVNKNRDGSDRHPIVSEADGVLMKKSVGGINFVINKAVYKKYVEPALETSASRGGNWDHMACINSMKDGKPVACLTPSVVQHMGFDSSMNHNEQPDVAGDFSNMSLPNVTLIGVDCTDINRLIRAADASCRDIQFGAVKLLSSQVSKDPRVVRCRPIKSKAEYSVFMMKELSGHVDTDFALVIQYDGHVINWQAWDDKYLDYDYIGATWWFKDGMNVGNGGFSLRSKRLMEALKDPRFMQTHPEDLHIARTYRPQLEEMGMKFAPEDVANRFSIEAYSTPPPANRYGGQFGFHGYNVDFRNTGFAPANPRKK